MRSIKMHTVAAALQPLGGTWETTVREAAMLAHEPHGGLAARLRDWVDAGPTQELAGRLEAQRRMLHCQATGAERLDLSHLPITSLPHAIGLLPKLTHLDVLNAGLHSLPESLGDLRRLKSLNVGGNDLECVPPEIGALKNLRRLFLNANKLRALPDDIARLARLELLHMPHNQLTALPESLQQLHGLADLDARNNQLESVPTWVMQMNLRHLDMGGNPLRDLRPLIQAHLHTDGPHEPVLQLSRSLSDG